MSFMHHALQVVSAKRQMMLFTKPQHRIYSLPMPLRA